MKKVIYIYSFIALLVTSACNDALDREIVMSLTADQVQKSYERSRARINGIYTYLPWGLMYSDGAMMASATDEAEHTLETCAIQKFNTGAWNQKDNPDGAWNNNFNGIYAANLFIANSYDIEMDYYRLDPDANKQESYQRCLDDIKRWRYEARFLRAYFYFELVKRYGGVPLITEPMDVESDFQIPRNTLDTCFKFITAECDSAAKNLPEVYSDNATNLGRITKGAALALKSRALLYAASDLFNNPDKWAPGYAHPEYISNRTMDRDSLWEEAAKAAKAVIDLKEANYSLSSDYPGLFKTYNNAEIILTRRGGSSNDFEKANFPIGYDLGNSGTTPSQNLVDAYEMKDGSEFDWNTPAHKAAPYSNRDPRLAYTVLLNNTNFNGRPVECWTGGKDGKGKSRATKTGYYLNKYVNSELDLLQGRTSVHSWIIFRLAEIYLNYAEALNEYDPGNADIKIYVDKVRQRSGVNMPTLPNGLDQSKMKKRIQHERRIELAFEDHRFWDVRRWMIAPETLGATLRGCEIISRGGLFEYNPIDVEKRSFTTKMYLYPIPESDLNIAGWDQNPLW